MKMLGACAFVVGLLAVTSSARLTAESTGPSHPELHGAAVIQFGINARTGQRGSQSVFHYSYTGGQTWQSPTTGKTYSVPDQLSQSPESQDSSVACESLDSNFSHVFDQYKSQYSFSNQGSSGHQGAFSGAPKHSSELKEIQKILMQNSTHNSTNSSGGVAYGYSTYKAQFYSLDMEPTFLLTTSSVWKAAVKALPDKIKSTHDGKLYKNFVEDFGTHYVSYGMFGGSIHSITFVNETVVEKHGGSRVLSEMHIQYEKSLAKWTNGGGPGRNSTTVAPWFKRDSKTVNFFTGGNVTLAQQGGDWLPTVADKAGLIQSTLSPLSELLLSDATKQATLAAFVKRYIAG